MLHLRIIYLYNYIRLVCPDRALIIVNNNILQQGLRLHMLPPLYILYRNETSCVGLINYNHC